jgi:hypothetical protein
MMSIMPLVPHVVVNRLRDFYHHFRLYLPAQAHPHALLAVGFPERLLSRRVLLCDSALTSKIAWKTDLILAMIWMEDRSYFSDDMGIGNTMEAV